MPRASAGQGSHGRPTRVLQARVGIGKGVQQDERRLQATIYQDVGDTIVSFGWDRRVANSGWSTAAAPAHIQHHGDRWQHGSHIARPSRKQLRIQ